MSVELAERVESDAGYVGHRGLRLLTSPTTRSQHRGGWTLKLLSPTDFMSWQSAWRRGQGMR